MIDIYLGISIGYLVLAPALYLAGAYLRWKDRRQVRPKESEETMHLDEQDNYATRQLPDGRILYVIPLLYGRARLGVGNKSMPLFFDVAY